MILFINFIRFLYSIYRVSKDPSDKNVGCLINTTNRCGPLAIKLLQFILMRNNIKNEKLQFVFEDCNKHAISKTQQLYLKDFGNEMSKDFIIDDIVLGSGSIGQVYKLYNWKLNRFVALKSKHPDVDKNLNDFVNVVKLFCWLFYPFNIYHTIITEYIENIHLQLDYKQEAKNTIRFKEYWKDECFIIVPEVLFYSENFICMSYHDGENFNNLNSQNQIITSLYLTFITMTGLLVHDFLHADLHTGNWKVVVKNGIICNLVLYDFGIMCSTGNLYSNKLIISNLKIKMENEK